MALDPIKTFQELDKSYRDFLNAQFAFRNSKIDLSAKEALAKECELLKGPFIEAHMPYKGTHSLQELVQLGLLNANIRNAFTNDEFSVYKRYNHQEKAIRLVGKKQSVIVASGTGSGKTECFFIPIINELLNEYDANTLCPGVRALLIYPMNALANDQIERLRQSLKSLPQITFGRYIGETPDGNRLDIQKGRKEANEFYRTANGEDALPNELLTRAEMEATPPHILVTNYAMLEYMLLRATSQKIFMGKYSKYFKFLVLDEAHTYKGAHGTEVAMLIRRLKEAVFGRISDCITCIGTSATLGGGEEEIDNVIEFAHDLFNEQFTRESIISSDTLSLIPVNGDIKQLDYYEKLFDEFKDYSESDKSLKLYNILSKDRFVYELRKRVLSKTITISELADLVQIELNINHENLENVIAKVIELCGEAISPTDGNPLINAKYHVFARTLEGGFITFADGVKVFTERRKEYKGYKVYELLNCMKCGQEYITGAIEIKNGDEYLVPSEDENNTLFMLSIGEKDVSVDEDDSVEDEFAMDDETKQEYVMCPKCGRLFPARVLSTTNCCDLEYNQFIKMTRIPAKARKNNCYKCGKSNKGTIRKLTTSEDAATEMLTRKLYQLLPEEVKKKETNLTTSIWGNAVIEDDTANGRKLLVFSDNRQDAAKFAIFIQERYNDWLWKNIIYHVITDMQESSISFKLLFERCYKIADKHNLFYDSKSQEDNENFAKKQIIKEVIELDPRMSLNRLGMLNIRISNIDKLMNTPVSKYFCDTYDISEEEFYDLVYFLFDSLRRQGCVEFPEGVDQRDDAFEPKNRYSYFKAVGGTREKDSQIYGFIPSDGKTNIRLNYVQNFYEYKGNAPETAKSIALKFLKEFADSFSSDFFISKIPVLLMDAKTHYLKLSLDSILFEKQVGPLYVCEKCGETSKTNMFGMCSKTNCGGQLIEMHDNEDRGNYYRHSFSNIQLIPMNAKEHTAQLASQTATDLQKSFKSNNVNILSCSTTFEMGVDIGSLESVVLRNVPPETSNYIQRAGRAGRRGSSAAFILTFAKRRSHDLTYYNDPIKMINGEIKAPYIELNNAYLVRRHVHSVIFGYLSYIGYNLRTAKDLLANGYLDNNLNIELYNILKKKPQKLYDSLNIIVPDGLKEEIGIDESWSFVKKLVDNNNPDNKDACLDNAINNLETSINELTKAQDAYSEDKKFIEAQKLERLIRTYSSKDYISFLAETNVLPRYGFPVYVVPLELNTDNITKGAIELDRDLRMAITEYAPGSQVVANGKYWKPYALKKHASREWPTFDFAICEKCGKIHFYQTALGVDSLNRAISCCHTPLKYKQMVIPQFGFVTKSDDKESIKLKDAVKYSSEAFFNGFENNSKTKENDIVINGKIIHSIYSPYGEMYVLNRGKYASKNKNIGVSFSVCEQCGFVQTSFDKNTSKGHKTYSNRQCGGKLVKCYLGHHFVSDALVLNFPIRVGMVPEYESILYAIIEGVSKCLEIDRREIGGAVWKNGDTSGFNIALFDTVPNGAGHVKRMTDRIVDILKTALEKVSGQCGCGEETCCYGCLRNYDNQTYHDTMSRGRAKQYLTWLLRE